MHRALKSKKCVTAYPDPNYNFSYDINLSNKAKDYAIVYAIETNNFKPMGSESWKNACLFFFYVLENLVVSTIIELV